MNSEASPILKFTKISEHAFPPVKGSEKAAGFDLKRLVNEIIFNINKVKTFPIRYFTWYCPNSAYDYVVPARGKELVKTDLQIELPHGCYGRVAPRSGLAVKNFIDVGGVLIILGPLF